MCVLVALKKVVDFIIIIIIQIFRRRPKKRRGAQVGVGAVAALSPATGLGAVLLAASSQQVSRLQSCPLFINGASTKRPPGPDYIQSAAAAAAWPEALIRPD